MMMDALFNDSWEHAVLAATAKAAGESSSNGYLGRTALQEDRLFPARVSGVAMR